MNARPHPNPMASQARHQFVSPKETSASRFVVPQERVSHSTRYDVLMIYERLPGAEKIEALKKQNQRSVCFRNSTRRSFQIAARV
jgi:hypothetical protein